MTKDQKLSIDDITATEELSNEQQRDLKGGRKLVDKSAEKILENGAGKVLENGAGKLKTGLDTDSFSASGTGNLKSDH